MNGNENDNLNTQKKISPTPEWQEQTIQNTKDQRFWLGIYAQYSDASFEQKGEIEKALKEEYGEEGLSNFLDGVDRFESSYRRNRPKPKSRF